MVIINDDMPITKRSTWIAKQNLNGTRNKTISISTKQHDTISIGNDTSWNEVKPQATKQTNWNEMDARSIYFKIYKRFILFWTKSLIKVIVQGSIDSLPHQCRKQTRMLSALKS